MDFIKFISPQIIKILLIIFFISNVNSQLSLNDLNYIKKTTLGVQNEDGLFKNSIESTFQSVYVLKVLNEKIPEVPKICRELKSQSIKEITSPLIKLNDLLKCKIDIKIEKKSEDVENLINYDMNSVHEKIFVWRHADNLDWVDLFAKIKNYLTDLNLFSLRSKSSESSLDATVKGLETLEIIYGKINDEKVREEVKDTIIKVFKGLQGEFQLLGNVIY